MGNRSRNVQWEAEGTGFDQPAELKAEGQNLVAVFSYLLGGGRDSFWRCTVKEWRWIQAAAMEIPAGYKRELFFHSGGH